MINFKKKLEAALEHFGIPEVDPATEIIPFMTAKEYNGLRESVKRDGVLETVVLSKGRLIDGRMRVCAAYDEDKPIKTIDYDLSHMDHHSWVKSENCRKNLSPDELENGINKILRYAATQCEDHVEGTCRKSGSPCLLDGCKQLREKYQV